MHACASLLSPAGALPTVMVLRRLYRHLDDATRRWPLTVKCSSGAVLAVIGDTAVQRIDGSAARSQGHDGARTARLATWRSLIHTPIVHFWFAALERRFPGAAAGNVLKKVACDQVIASPSLHVFFLPYMALAEGHGLEEAKARTERKFLPLMKANYCLWPLVHLVTFSVIPPVHRVLWVNCWATVWMGMLSWINAS